MVANKFTSFRLFTLFVDVCLLHLQEWWDEDEEQEEEESEEPALLWPFFRGRLLEDMNTLQGASSFEDDFPNLPRCEMIVSWRDSP